MAGRYYIFCVHMYFQGEAVDILGQPMEYAITEVANVKKNNRKEDKQNVSVYTATYIINEVSFP